MPLALVPYNIEYAQKCYDWRYQPQALKHNALIQHTFEEFKERLFKESSDFSELINGKNYRWFLKLNDEIIGYACFFNVNLMMMTAEIGYSLDEKYHGQGYGTQLVNLAIDKVFSETKLRKICAIVHEENLPSIKILRKNGFVIEGVLREHFILNDVPVNVVFLGILRREWKQG